MPAPVVTTFRDLVDHLTDWLGANPGAEAQRDSRRAILNGIRDLTTQHIWSYYYQRGRINTFAPYQTGTITYTHTGGTAERLVTLAGGSWPTWAPLANLLCNGNITYDVATRLNSTQLTLTSASNPGMDLGAQSFTLYEDTFSLPIDCVSVGQAILVGRVYPLGQEHPSTWLERQRIFHGVAQPRTYCLRGSPDYMGTMSMSLYPPPDMVYQVDFIYQRIPRALKIDAYTTGKVSVSVGSNIVSGAGTAWTSRLVGTVFRVSRNNDLPTGIVGANPSICDRIVTAVTSTTSLTLDDTVPESASSVAYILSDPVDVEPTSMLTALQRCCEFQLATSRRMRDRDACEQAYKRELITARETDSRSFKDSRAGGQSWYPYRLADHPSGPDVS